jgi:hypothetical protein
VRRPASTSATRTTPSKWLNHDLLLTCVHDGCTCRSRPRCSAMFARTSWS